MAVLFLAYNEVETIKEECLLMQRMLSKNGWLVKVYVAEGGSNDGTTELLFEMENEGIVKHIKSEERTGYRDALILGLSATTEPIVLQLDSGLKFVASDLELMVNAYANQAMLIGRRVHRKDSLIRRFLTWSYNTCIRMLFPQVAVHDADCGARIYDGEYVREIIAEDLFFPELVSSEIAIRLSSSGKKVEEFPIRYLGRSGSSRSFSSFKLASTALSGFVRLLRLRREI